MKIDKITLYHLRMPLRSPFETSFGRSEARDSILIEAYSDGQVGFGECVADRDPGYSSETAVTAWHILGDYLIPTMIGMEISSLNMVFSTLNFVRGHYMAKAGLEMAVWDLVGKTTERSLKNMLGGNRDRVAVGVSVGIQASPSKLVDVVSDYLAAGYQRVKIKIKPGRDVEDARAVRKVYPDLKLQVDANSAYTLETAKALQPLDKLDLLLIEQPLAEDDLWDHARMQSKFQTPICLDETIISPRHARQAIEMKACRIINIKAGRVGGLSQARLIHDLCYAQGVPVWCGGMLETGVGRASNLALASLPGFTLPGDISATERYYLEDITNESFSLNPDSTINVPDRPGLGVSINRDSLEKFSLVKKSFP